MDLKKNKNQNQQTTNEENKKLKEELEKVRKEIEDYKNKYLRALADYQNYEKRIREEKMQIGQQAVNQVVLKLIPFLDNLEKAEIFVKDTGLKMIRDSFYRMLQEMGLKEIQVLGKEFDPHLAEAVEVVKGEKDNIITEVVRKGYRLNDVILRIAQVKVAKKITN